MLHQPLLISFDTVIVIFNLFRSFSSVFIPNSRISDNTSSTWRPSVGLFHAWAKRVAMYTGSWGTYVKSALRRCIIVAQTVHILRSFVFGFVPLPSCTSFRLQDLCFRALCWRWWRWWSRLAPKVKEAVALNDQDKQCSQQHCEEPHHKQKGRQVHHESVFANLTSLHLRSKLASGAQNVACKHLDKIQQISLYKKMALDPTTCTYTQLLV